MQRIPKKLVTFTLFVMFSSLTWADAEVPGFYFGQRPPNTQPKLFAPDFITIPNRSERMGSFTPDGREFYFTTTHLDWSGNRIMKTSLEGGIWTAPTVVPFSRNIDVQVYVSPDGQRLFFCSSRPSSSWLSFNIWMCTRQGADWSAPVRLAINSPRVDFAGTCTWDGTLYFASERDGMVAIFRSISVGGEYTTVEKLPAPINTGLSDQCPWIAPDESYLIFGSSRQGSRDLYLSYRNQDDTWTEPINLGFPINTQDYEWFPTITPDGQYLMYSRCRDISNINHDLYWVRTAAFMPAPNGPIQNLNSQQRFGSIQCAVSYADAGDTPVLGPGLYRESIVLEKDAVLQSMDPNDPYYVGGTIIQADPNEPVVTLQHNSPACTLAGLTLRAGSVGILGMGSAATLKDCRIMDNTLHGLELSNASKLHLKHCLIAANGETGITMHATEGGRRGARCEPLIEDCIIVDNGLTGLVGGQPVIVDSIIQEP